MWWQWQRGWGCTERLWSLPAPSSLALPLEMGLKRCFPWYFPGLVPLAIVASSWKFQSPSEYSHFFSHQFNDGVILAWWETLFCHYQIFFWSSWSLFPSPSFWLILFTLTQVVCFFHALLPLRVFCDPTIYHSVFSFFFVFFLLWHLCFIAHPAHVLSVPDIPFILRAFSSFPYRSPVPAQ